MRLDSRDMLDDIRRAVRAGRHFSFLDAASNRPRAQAWRGIRFAESGPCPNKTKRPETEKRNQTMTQEIMDCIDACTSCMQLCQECADACEKMGGMDECVRLCRLCHDECDRHSKAIHNDDHSHLESCISICERCADECAKGAEHMAICGRCAAACRKCAEACRRAAPAKAKPQGGCCQGN